MFGDDGEEERERPGSWFHEQRGRPLKRRSENRAVQRNVGESERKKKKKKKEKEKKKGKEEKAKDSRERGTGEKAEGERKSDRTAEG